VRAQASAVEQTPPTGRSYSKVLIGCAAGACHLWPFKLDDLHCGCLHGLDDKKAIEKSIA
jgi:hypothetical protein